MSLTPKGKQIKVCLVTISLANGGAERSTALLSKMLVNKGFEVHIICIKNEVTYSYAGTLKTLGTLKKKYGVFSTLNRLQVFKRYLKEHDFDFVIDNRTRPSFFKESVYLNYIYKNSRLIYVIRSSNLSLYFPDNISFVKKQASKTLKYIGVSKTIVRLVSEKYALKNCVHIYNPVSLAEIREQSNAMSDVPKNYKYILALGRLDEDVKNYTLLINAYKKSKLREQKIKLIILGSGPDKDIILSKIRKLNMEEHIQLYPFISNPFPWIKQALYTVLTSRFEGFPRVLIESLAVGNPVISVDCVSGPSEIINHQINGLLVENNNPSLLAESMNKFIFDEKLYHLCKKNTISSVKHLDIEFISEKWNQLLQNELH